MKICTICLCLDGDKMLLGRKKRGFGTGKINGLGGKVKDSESIKSSAVREVLEESSILVEESAFKQVAKIDFWFEKEFVFQSHVFVIRQFSGEAKESEEMGDFEWYPIDNLPFNKMWVDDELWMPLVLRDGKKIEGRVDFNADGSEVKDFSYKETEF